MYIPIKAISHFGTRHSELLLLQFYRVLIYLGVCFLGGVSQLHLPLYSPLSHSQVGRMRGHVEPPLHTNDVALCFFGSLKTTVLLYLRPLTEESLNG